MNMINQKKYKIIDTVFFEDEIDYLLFRFTELNESVDLFIVLEGNQKESVFLKNIEMFKKWETKIIHILSDLSTEDEFLSIIKTHKLDNVDISHLSSNEKLRLSQISDLISKILTLNLNFDDVVLISEIDELPEMPSMNILQEHLSFEPVFFSQKNFLWSKDFVNEQNHLGTSCYLFSHFILSSHLVFLYSIFKNYNIIEDPKIINFGYRFSYFNSIQESIKKISRKHNQDDLESIENLINNSRNNLLYYDLPSQSNPKPLKKYLGRLPLNIDMLNTQPIGREIPKKHLVIIGIDSFHDIDTKDFDSVSIITHTNDISVEEHKQVHDNIEIHYIQIPNKKYYDVFVNDNTLENFQKMYFLNEIKKIIILQHPLEIDIFEFYFAGKPISYPWSIIKDNFIYDLLHN